MATVLAGLLAFFLLEKLVLWRHSHGHDAHRDDAEETEHEHALHGHAGDDQGRSGLMILIGTAVHNFCDGVVIAASFLADVTARARDDGRDRRARGAAAGRRFRGAAAFGLHAKRARSPTTSRRASRRSSARSPGYFALAQMQQLLPTVLAIAAASLLYVAVADLIPSLHRRARAARDREAGAGDRARHRGHLRRARGAGALSAHARSFLRIRLCRRDAGRDANARAASRWP